MRSPRTEENKENDGGSTDAVGQLNDALAAIETFQKQAEDYLQQARVLQVQVTLGQIGIEVRGGAGLARIAVARIGTLVAIERAKNDALSQVQNTNLYRRGTNPTMNG